jgi:hypothetical protein
MTPPSKIYRPPKKFYKNLEKPRGEKKAPGAVNAGGKGWVKPSRRSK